MPKLRLRDILRKIRKTLEKVLPVLRRAEDEVRGEGKP